MSLLEKRKQPEDGFDGDEEELEPCPACHRVMNRGVRPIFCPVCHNQFCNRLDCYGAHRRLNDAAGHPCCATNSITCGLCNQAVCMGVCSHGHLLGPDAMWHNCCRGNSTVCPACGALHCNANCYGAHRRANDASNHACCVTNSSICAVCNGVFCNAHCAGPHQRANDPANHPCCASTATDCAHCGQSYCNGICAGGHAEADGDCGHKTCPATGAACADCNEKHCKNCIQDLTKFARDLCKTCLDKLTEETTGGFKVKHQRVPGSNKLLKRTVSVIGGIKSKAVKSRKTPPPPLSSGKTDANADIEELKQYDRGHLVALELDGRDDHRLIAPMIRQFNQSGSWRQMETSIGDLLGGTDLEDVKDQAVSADTSLARTNVGLSLRVANVIDVAGWEMEVYLFYEDDEGDPRIPVWFYVRLFHNKKMWTHFSLGNRCGKKATMPTKEEILEFQAAKDIYGNLSKIDREKVVRGELKKLYEESDDLRPNKLLELMHDVNLHCDVKAKARVFKTMQLETEQGNKAYTDFQRAIFRKFNRWSNGGKLKSDVQRDDQYPGEGHDIYLELDECGGRNAPEVDHIDPSYQLGGNFYINGRLVSFLHNHLYREKKTLGSEPVKDWLLRLYREKDALAFSDKGNQARYCLMGKEYTNPMAWISQRAVWISSEQVVAGTQSAEDFLNAHFADDVLFADAVNNRNLGVSQASLVYKNPRVWQEVKERQVFLQAEDARKVKYQKEQDLEPKYKAADKGLCDGRTRFINDKDHPERKRLLKLIQDGTVDLCKPSDVLKTNGGLEADAAASDFEKIEPEDARKEQYYKDLILRWNAVKPA